MGNRRKYSNNDITVFWRPNECIHSSICYTKLISVFNPRRRPWIVLSNTNNQEIINIINQCPTKALTFMWNDSERNNLERSPKAEKNIDKVTEEFNSKSINNEETTIQIMKNGPIVISGDFKVFDANNCVMRTMKITSLCRCGHTHNPPFCDGSHFRYQFRDDE